MREKFTEFKECAVAMKKFISIKYKHKELLNIKENYTATLEHTHRVKLNESYVR